ncbi:flavin-containing monooxygenase [Pseudarthrobacter oxydans]|uniref:flavin-containing monooxygenase n=1 Tax=Pseudarthrobacter oxydans TaxID=1671 RepID=UPI002938900D|nr:NAD(P)/FAD-dependent oxidoreductase [Actinomycetes bacterium ARC8]
MTTHDETGSVDVIDIQDPPAGRTPHTRVAVIGAGFSGLGAAIRLKQEGTSDFLIFERAGELGGTWRDNSYPGCACDVMSLLYSYSFAQNPEWSTTFGKRDEIFQYLLDCATRFGIRESIRFNHSLEKATWDDYAQVWRLQTSQGNYTANILVTGTGYLSDPVLPEIKGLDGFTGDVFHSSSWNHSLDLTGKKVAVIGTGASAIQFIPKIQPLVASLDIYQRTPAWIAPKPDRKISSSQLWLRRHVPGYQTFRRNFNMWGREILAFMMARPAIMQKTLQGSATGHLAKQVRDPQLREKLTPSYTVGCKRILFSNDYYPAITQANVETVTGGAEEVRGSTIVSGGKERSADVIILATGFQAVNRPIAKLIEGKDGATLEQAWEERMSAFAGTTVSGFPNLFMLLGPNTALGHSAQTVMIEAQLEYLVSALKVMDQRSLSSVDVLPEAQAKYKDWLNKRFEGTVWAAGNCVSWYQDSNGENPSIWPTYTWLFRRHTSQFKVADYLLTATADTSATDTAGTPAVHA